MISLIKSVGKGISNAKNITQKSEEGFRFLSRSIFSAGNGQQRFVVSGFSGPNLTNTDITYYNFLSRAYRPIINGFSKEAQLADKSILGTGRVQCFYNGTGIGNGSRKVQRHNVYDFRTDRRVIRGFSPDVQTENIISHGNGNPLQLFMPPKTPIERVVVQGFSHNPPQNIVYKPIGTPSNTHTVIQGYARENGENITRTIQPQSARTVVKGFCIDS